MGVEVKSGKVSLQKVAYFWKQSYPNQLSTVLQARDVVVKYSINPARLFGYSGLVDMMLGCEVCGLHIVNTATVRVVS